mmetsp:Transcript_10011/g.11668  ORF Transcript_10011/g.11668 Transcript_10011/m.11668 type:complete len:169 (+) Transcript_10011:183-689(+)|eukprot:CAMPEP_0197862684 /NCGR_PEP_ID=MMETSP1438-20131217/39649_1 /TAXON_ID=1461541 /ORGANISM="Pterosperma sp., Strain CCMP1384" /LENGTH=168 /DNA_ID=CAMNT_0043480331 /DNA_START=41 /DNA_END=547 /DNA_ORIENTATION=-
MKPGPSSSSAQPREVTTVQDDPAASLRRRSSSSGATTSPRVGGAPQSKSKIATPQNIELDPGLLAFVTDMRALIDRGAVQQMGDIQRNILLHTESSGAMLREFNDYSQQTYNHVLGDFQKNTKLLKDMKKDLDYIFKHTRMLREKIRTKYPNSFEGLALKRPDAPEDE